MLCGRFTTAALALLVSVSTTFAFTTTSNSPAAFLPNGVKKTQHAGFSQQDAAATSPLFMSAVAESGTKTVEEYIKDRGGNRVIKKVLIANNGMAATKSILSMRQWAYMELGDERAIQFVAMATPEDMKANAEFIRLADEYIEVPGGVNRNNYANVDVICRIAQEQGVDAVWPGWGHASENPKLPETLTKLGIKFIGPPAPVMSVLGDKIAANILAQTANVPSIPWSGSFGGEDDGPLKADLTDEGTIPDETFEKATCRNVEEAIVAAEKIGYEEGLMIKASEGGGGKGIRFVDNEVDLRNAFIQVQNEVVGSPVFIMQLCKNARHLEVQIVGDEHGNAVALNGRDCSTQRRFQKIFEEGPPTIAKPASFTEMQKAAQRLTQSIGYVGAGTVEYLYNAATDKFFFLELNPRLQVEHPVTEGITGVNMPATQLQVAMGIPLYNIPQVRMLYGKEDAYGKDKIDFIEEDYMPINTHVIAARITAENPDEGFKPTAGSIERVKFQSTPSVWGYFSVGVNGGIHEFADSQFGHLFAKGANREQARKALILALKEMEVRGEIRTTVEYLVQLLETKEFIENTIDTAWLDGIIKEKSVSVDMPQDLVVVSAAIFKAFQHVEEGTADVMESFEKGQVSTGGIPGVNSFETEIAYKDKRYNFHVERIAADVYRFTLGSNTIEARVTPTAEGALLATFAGETHRIFGMDEPLGLRLVLDGNTILMPSIIDPSEFRTDVTGKVVRYLKENGEEIAAGEPYVEIEAMKMIMPVKATETGKITNALSPGSVIAAGDLLASIELKDPSKVKKIETFDGQLTIQSTAVEVEVEDMVKNILAGYDGNADAVVQKALEGAEDMASASTIVVETLEEFLRVESIFAGKLMDDVVRELTKANIDNLEVVISEILAHQKLKSRSLLIQAMLRQVENFSFRFGESLPDDLLESIQKLTELTGKGYGQLVVAADMITRESRVPSFESRVEELRSQLQDTGVDLQDLAMSATLSAGLDLLTYLLSDEDTDIKVRENAAEVYIRRLYRAHRMLDVKVSEKDGRLTCSFQFQYAEVEESQSVTHTGLLSVAPDVASIGKVVPDVLGDLSEAIGDKPATVGGYPINTIHIVSGKGSDDIDVSSVEGELSGHSAQLKQLGVRLVNVCVPKERRDPSYYTFPDSLGFKEDILRRDMRPTRYQLLELAPLSDNYNLERLPAIGKNNQIFVGTEKSNKPFRGGPPQVVFVRGISHSSGLVSSVGALRVLQQGLDELERAQASEGVNPQSSSRVYLHSLANIKDVTPLELSSAFAKVIGGLKSQLAQRLLRLRVDEIEVKFRISSKAEDGSDVTEVVRLVASSMGGEWLKAATYVEETDPVTGLPAGYCEVLPAGTSENCVLDPYATSNIVQTKRSVARRVGSTYAYDFLGLMEVGLFAQWEAYLASIGSDAGVEVPASVFESQELLEGDDGELYLGSRPVGTNKVAMVAWLVNMKTPEYPNGRDIVLIANDVTVQSGSFGVEEDEVFFKASKYARERGLPRVYLACNAGARIGLVDELKSKIKIKFTDAENPSKGFDYLYLSDEDYKALPEGSVIAHKTDEGWALDDVIGTVHGIGVENLQGSGKIAGETSRAYDEIFTLSYVTGRSVGIGAYLVRLGQRVIQQNVGPILLTGYSALNKLLGREVYTSQDQLGGPQIMVPNGVTHETVADDQEGVTSILKWLSFVPEKVGALPSARLSADPVDRAVQWRPTPTPYDPRLMMAGTSDMPGFFDQGSFTEYLAGWGKSVVIGRGRLGGISFGAIAVETRLVDKVVPADPADPNSREAILPQAGQVLFPDSSYKTAQAIRDFDKEGLPIMIFANWRGFSGGSRDMAGEILKFGSMIVDALREYEHPVFMYLPPHGELRGGSWVVVDPTINEEKMEMYADPDSRGGILEPAGITEIKFRLPDQVKLMHILDPELQLLDNELEMTETEDDTKSIQEQIKAREEVLKPVYLQAATEFADLHDKTGRMKAKGVIKSAVPWEESREFFYYRAKRRLSEDYYSAQLRKADPSLTKDSAAAVLSGMFSGDWEDDKAVAAWFDADTALITDKVKSTHAASMQAKIEELTKELNAL
ncbi:Acetyl-CoA carboxylase 1 [Seminavis robusta]|uniref:Acetyl-CoA carboxylase 1 n=1 Tax=Seminavis robusta TaxID=568900 RepID=A0A9N8H408_9STRA|nr:Acetyl-CoA carboxylase 1 [Seminavis robusta]|eukprot:Sro50_g029050.1 Acetyl-CoA carboxylase 1 (2085) ;mRNA; f:64365-71161